MTVPNKPAVGETNWGDKLNTSLDYLDASTATLTATVATKAPIASPTFTGTVSGVTATHVGLGNVTDTSDASKPVSTAQQTALDLKANLVSPTFTTPSLGVATATSINGTTIPSSATLAVTASPTFTGTVTKPISSITSYQKYAVAAVTTPITAATYTVPDTDTFIIFNSASAISVTLPAAASYTGRMLSLKTISTGAVTSASSNVVALATSTAASTLFSANTAGKWTTLVSNGTNWVIMSQN